MEVSWINTRLGYGESTRKRCANLWKIYGTFVEKQIWRNCGKLTHWKIADWKIPKTRYNGAVRETKRKD